MTLDEDQRDWARRALTRTGFPAKREDVALLTRRVEQSIQLFKTHEANRITLRQLDDALRRLWHLANAGDPPIGQIRARIGELQPSAVAFIEDRMAGIWDRVFRDESYPSDGFQTWAQTASAEKLVKAVLNCIDDGGAMVPDDKLGPRLSRGSPATYAAPLVAQAFRRALAGAPMRSCVTFWWVTSHVTGSR